MIGICQVTDCGNGDRLTRGLCPKHYMRLLRRGRTDIVRKPGLPGKQRRKHRLYPAWAGMINRCYNPNNSSYRRYGGRGILVCQRWRDDFLNFLADMGERPEGKTLDRIDPNGPYEKENCRWATLKEQRANMTIEGDQRMRRAMSEGVKRRWREWRAAKALE